MSHDLNKIYSFLDVLRNTFRIKRQTLHRPLCGYCEGLNYEAIS